MLFVRTIIKLLKNYKVNVIILVTSIRIISITFNRLDAALPTDWDIRRRMTIYTHFTHKICIYRFTTTNPSVINSANLLAPAAWLGRRRHLDGSSPWYEDAVNPSVAWRCPFYDEHIHCTTISNLPNRTSGFPPCTYEWPFSTQICNSVRNNASSSNSQPCTDFAFSQTRSRQYIDMCSFQPIAMSLAIRGPIKLRQTVRIIRFCHHIGSWPGIALRHSLSLSIASLCRMDGRRP